MQKSARWVPLWLPADEKQIEELICFKSALSAIIKPVQLFYTFSPALLIDDNISTALFIINQSIFN